MVPSSERRTKTPTSEPDGSFIDPFSNAAFSVIWSATVASNIGTWIQNAAAGWLMTELNPEPFVVSLVQVATTLPMFLFILPAGALADIFDRKRLLLVIEIAATLAVAALAVVIWAGVITPTWLLLLTFVIGVTAALGAPAWQAIVPELVPRRHLRPAIALNSIGFNVSRAIGPPLGGLLMMLWGRAAPFWINAASNLGILVALLWWRRPRTANQALLPPERLGQAIRAGLRYASNDIYLRATLVRAAGFFIFASAYWSLLPLVTRDQLHGDAALYSMLLGAIGGGAVLVGLALPKLSRRLGAERLFAFGVVGTALTLLLYGTSSSRLLSLLASILAGAAWISALATLNVSAQFALPEWVRGRGLSIYGMVMFGSLTFGSLLWGKLAGIAGLPVAHFIAAGGMLLSLPTLGRWKLQTAAYLDLTPSLHWAAPVVMEEVRADRGPVLVTVEYEVDVEHREKFISAVRRLGHTRQRDGAFDWGIFEDAAQPGRFVETFLLVSWLEHLRQHERVTQADRETQESVNRFQKGGTPKVAHYIAPG